MSRSLKKGPYINVSLEKKILAMNESGKKNVVKTYTECIRLRVLPSKAMQELKALKSERKFYVQQRVACECDMRGRQGHENDDYPPRARLLAALTCVQGVDTASVAAATRARCEAEKRTKDVGASVGEAIRQARIAALRAWLAEQG